MQSKENPAEFSWGCTVIVHNSVTIDIWWNSNKYLIDEMIRPTWNSQKVTIHWFCNVDSYAPRAYMTLAVEV